MQLNWTLITYLVIGLFAWSGAARGWWKEAVTTVFLALLIFLLQYPDLAQSLVDQLNALIATIWNALPNSVTVFIGDLIDLVFGTATNGAALQANAGDPATWVIILIVVVTMATMIGRASFSNAPDFLGALFGAGLGGLNGYLILGLFREYLDGRGLPGRTPPATEITLAGSSAVGPAASSVSIQATNMPSITILDSAVPWIIIAGGALLVFVVLNTKVALETNKKGGKRINYKIVPPFYKKSPPPKEEKLTTIVKDITKDVQKMLKESG
jgi:hypothetical protein